MQRASWVVVVCLAMVVGAVGAAQGKSPLVFEVVLRGPVEAPIDGHVILVMAREERPEPRFQITGNVESAQIFGVDVEHFAPGMSARIDGKTIGFPLRSLGELPPGDYHVQAVLNVYETFHLGDGKTVVLPPDKGEGQHWQTKPGNPYSEETRLHLDPAASGVLRIELNKRVPRIEDEQAAVDSLLDWHPTSASTPEPENQWIRHLRIKSELLTRFWGRPVYLNAIVLLPDKWAEHPDARFPMVLYQDHYHRHFVAGTRFRTEPPDAEVKNPMEHAQQVSAYRFYQDWVAGRLPRVIIVNVQHPTPYFDDSYAVNSASQGPYGDAIQKELLPVVEKQFRAIPDGWAHAVYGGSTGGWEALATQVFYPDDYNGAWVFCPDPIDFRAYGPVNIYEDKNAFYNYGLIGKIEQPEERTTDGHLKATMEQANRYEYVLGTHGRSGEQWDIWQATFSPMGEDGYPQPIFDKLTGEIDKTVAAYWKEHYDLSAIMQRDWAKLGPKLVGKLHFAVGDMDTWYLNNAVHLLDRFLSHPGTVPAANATFDYGPRMPHCYTGEPTGMKKFAPWYSGTTINQRVLPKMVERMEKTAPAGADLKSWKY